VVVAFARVSLLIPHSHSLKEKRAVVRKIKDRVKARHDVRVSEVDGLDTWQRAVLGFAVVSGQESVAERVVDAVLRFVRDLDEAQVVAEHREVLHYGEDGLS
jgi:hypothetical protein